MSEQMSWIQAIAKMAQESVGGAEYNIMWYTISTLRALYNEIGMKLR